MTAKFNSNNIIYLNKVDSTNLYAQELLKEKKITEGCVIVAHEQSSGKGQRGTQWSSKPYENLTFSIILRPDFLPLEKVFYISKIIALSLADFLDKMTVAKIQIKWPNDILANAVKIGGILIENNISGTRISSTVVGIGLNINQKEFEGDFKATSLSLINEIDYSIKDCIEAILEHLYQRYEQLYENKFERIETDYLKKLYALGKPMQFSDAHSQFWGKIIGVSESGFLRVENEDNTIQSYDIKEIKFIA